MAIPYTITQNDGFTRREIEKKEEREREREREKETTELSMNREA